MSWAVKHCWYRTIYNNHTMECNIIQQYKQILAGIHHRHLLRPDVVRQPPEVQQHHEAAHAQQQHGGKNLDSRHLLQEFTEIRCPLDHDSQPAPEAVEQWKSHVHPEVGYSESLFVFFSLTLQIFVGVFLFIFCFFCAASVCASLIWENASIQENRNSEP